MGWALWGLLEGEDLKQQVSRRSLLPCLAGGLTLFSVLHAQRPFKEYPGTEYRVGEIPLPPGWDEKRVKDLIAHYENQTEDEEAADIAAARKAADITLMAIPSELVPEVRALLARK